MRAIEQLDKQPIYLYNLDVQLKMYHEDPWKVNLLSSVLISIVNFRGPVKKYVPISAALIMPTIWA